MNDQEIFNSEELKENDERKRELIKFVASEEAVLIVGAGSSVRVGYLDWSGLLKKLEDLAGDDFKSDDIRRKENPLGYAEDVKSHISKNKKERYEALLYDLFKPKNYPVDNLHKTLVRLPFRGILTTNYDTVLETALAEIDPLSATDNSLVIDSGSADRVDEFLRAMNDGNLTRRIAHLHGKFDPPSSIILSIEDYKHAYGLDLTNENRQQETELKLHRKLLWAVFATRKVVFLGFSMNDPYLNKILETVSEDLRRWNKSIYFTITSISPDGAENSKTKATGLRREYGVETVFYEDLDGSHQNLDNIVTEIAKACGVETPAPIVPQSKSQDVLDWLEQVNKLMERGIGDDEN